MNQKAVWQSLVCGALLFWFGCALAEASYSPYAEQDYPKNVYWGDTHLHTSLSEDAYAFGDRLEPSKAYAIARGQTVTASNGMPVRLHRPLDFLVIADHAEVLGVLSSLVAKDPLLLSTDVGKRLLPKLKPSFANAPTSDEALVGLGQLELVAMEALTAGPARTEADEAFNRSIWSRVIEEAERNNEPGRFTAFVGYEWSSGGRKMEDIGKEWGNLHRVVIFKDGAPKVSQVLPFSSFDSEDPEALWNFMADYEKRTGGEVLAIPHNGNLSNGGMFSLESLSGNALTRSYAERRSRWEPLYEVTQIKGDSEAHPFLSPTDEFADYERWNSWNAVGKVLPEGRSWNDAERRIKEGEYARAALKRGLRLEAQLGINPFKFGLIGSTDAHTSLPAAEEDNFWGKAPMSNPAAGRVTGELGTLFPTNLAKEHPDLGGELGGSFAWNLASSGYAAVWAVANTREALFAAMKRRETYASTGPRMTVRFFGGWSFSTKDAWRSDFAEIGYRNGVPMGADLSRAPPGGKPRFLVRAVKDPDGANLDRVQVIKGWLDAENKTHEKIFNVALSDGRKADASGKVPPVESTVDLKNASYTNSMGDPELAVMWTDEEFNPAERAFYYVRVLEIPTPRWTAYDAKVFGVKDVAPEVPMVTQERAYTSPIWYTPESPR